MHNARGTARASIVEALQQAIERRHEGKLAEAEAIFRQVLQREPEQRDALHLLGLLHHERGERERGLELVDRALVRGADCAPFHGSRGQILAALGRKAEALESFARCAALSPQSVLVHVQLGALQRELGRLEESERSIQRALELDPKFAPTWANLGLLHQVRGDWSAAEAAYRRGLELSPSDPQLHDLRSGALVKLNRVEEAAELLAQGIRLRPDSVQTRGNLAATLKELGEPELAAAEFERALAIRPSAPLQLRDALVLPAIARSLEQIARFRQRFAERLRELTARGIRLQDPLAQVNTTSFYLAYHGLDDRELQQAAARLYLQACPELAFRAPHCAEPRGRAPQRPRLGIVSAFLYDHTIGRLFLGMIEKLAEADFEVVLFSLPRPPSAISAALQRAAGEPVLLRASLPEARAAVAAARLDVLLYPDIGMEPLTYYLAFARLAPLQCVSWGHPVTTGIPNVDCFVSSQLIEPEGAERHYSERLVRLSRLPACYERPEIAAASAAPPSRESLGLPADRHLYVCLQSLMKLHPDFDAVLAGVLRGDPRGEVVLLEGVYPRWTALLRERLARSFPDAVERVRFLPRMGRERFLEVLRAADALLDPLHFGGGNSSYEAFALGAPLVTWPGPFMRGRVSAGAYRQMGVLDLVARDADHYVELALRLGRDRDWRRELSARILERSAALFADGAVIGELAGFLRAELQSASSAPDAAYTDLR